MIRLYQFYSIWGLPNASPFCMKVETYLRMTGLPYVIQNINNPQQAPKGKLPYIEIAGIRYPDSELIIELLKETYGDPLDRELSDEQRALGVLVDNVLCERVYWLAVYLRWQNPSGWDQIKHEYFSRLPILLKLFLPTLIRRKMLKTLYAQGNGRHTTEEIIRLGCKTMDALTSVLGNKPFFLGDKPTSVDATAFSFIANLLICPLNDSLKQHLVEIDTLKTYCSRMWDTYYSDCKKPLALN